MERDEIQRDEIHQDLIRQVITEPLLSEVQRDRGGKALHKIVIDLNLEYAQGRDAALARVTELARDAIAATKAAKKDVELPQSIGSQNNPYMVARLPTAVILRMIDADRKGARSRAKTEQQTRSPAQPPMLERRYRAIHRMWPNFSVHGLIDCSVSTVKADAARRAFLAEGKGIVWAVIDSGIDEKHDHFKTLSTLDVTKPVRHCDFTRPGGCTDAGSPRALVDRFGHGTHVGGIIAGSLAGAKAIRTRLIGNQFVEEQEAIPAIGGMAPACRLVSMKVLDDDGFGDIAMVIAALDTIQQINDHGRHILIHGVNLSVGYEFDPKWFACGQSPICLEVDRLVRSGVVVVAAAGNTGYGAQAAEVRQTGTGLALTINDPGNSDLAITVGSTHRDMPHTYGVSYFSSKGPTGDGRLKPDLVAPGERILSCTATGGDAEKTREYGERSGTSMSAPHVSGVIAAFLSIRREYIGRPEAVKKLFMDTATDLSRDRTFQGKGLVDLMRAIQAV